MLTAVAMHSRREQVALVVALSLLALLFLTGGASRADALSQPLARLASLAVIAVAIFLFDRAAWLRARVPFLFIAALAAVMIIQLVPLPPAFWHVLPGQERHAAALASIQLGGIWRPMSLTPDGTVNSLLALLPALAAILIVSLLPRQAMPILLGAILCGIVLSGLFGALQLSSGSGYLYRITSEGSAVGLFANRNHQALLLACGLPMLAAWAVLPRKDAAYHRLQFWLSLCAAAAVYPLLLITGSRAGLALGALATAGGGLIVWSGARFLPGDARIRGRLLCLALVPISVAMLATAATIMLSRDEALQRVLGGVEDELRIDLLPVIWQMARDFFPAGAGFGAFDTVYRMYEPVASLDSQYLNHAHNDWLQIVVEGGLPTLLIVTVGFILYLLASAAVWRRGVVSTTELMGRTASIVLFAMMVASIGDYPLRTPTMSALFVIAAVWLAQAWQAPAERRGNAGVGSPQRLG